MRGTEHTPSPTKQNKKTQIGGSLARAAIVELKAKGLIKPIAVHGSQQIWTRAVGDVDPPAKK